jgi:hypothetical protein
MAPPLWNALLKQDPILARKIFWVIDFHVAFALAEQVVWAALRVASQNL